MRVIYLFEPLLHLKRLPDVPNLMQVVSELLKSEVSILKMVEVAPNLIDPGSLPEFVDSNLLSHYGDPGHLLESLWEARLVLRRHPCWASPPLRILYLG